MVNNSKIDNDEINLIELMYTLWKGKWKIAAAVAISFIAAISYQLIQTPNNNFTAITEIKPASYSEINKYFVFNNLIAGIEVNTDTNNTDTNNTDTNNTDTNNTVKRVNVAGKINEITSLRLLNIYIDVLSSGSVIEDAIRKFNLLEASQYNNEQEYNEAIIRLASSVKILFPSVNDETNLETSYHTIHFKYHDAEKWISALKYVDEFTNKLVRKTLLEQYKNTLIFLERKQKFQLEDILVKINNYLIDYDREISDKVAYLKEQSAIAKKLGIVKNTIEVQTFGTQNALLSNIQTDSPFYLRGYEAIDKEIELIKLRENQNAFIEGLFELEKKKRAIEQDQTIERVKLALQSDLLVNNNDFSAASLKAITTKFVYENNTNKEMLVIAIVIGLIAGIFYVIISNAFQSHRISKKKTN